MNVKGRGGYVGSDGVPRLNVLDVQKQIRSLPKPVIAMVNGYAIGGGHVLHLMCDLTIASDNALYRKKGSFVVRFSMVQRLINVFSTRHGIKTIFSSLESTALALSGNNFFLFRKKPSKINKNINII